MLLYLITTTVIIVMALSCVGLFLGVAALAGYIETIYRTWHGARRARQDWPRAQLVQVRRR
jgi:hypothetical protein